MSYPQPPKSLGGLAEYYGCSDRTIKRHRAAGAPLNDLDGMIEYLAHHQGAPGGMKRRVNEYKAHKSGGSPGLSSDADWAEFEKSVRTDDPKEAMEKIARARDFAAFKFEKASRLNDKDDMGFYANLLSKFEGVFHDAQLRAKKLGIDDGELLPRATVENFLGAFAYWLMRSTDGSLDYLSRRLVNLPSPEAARAILEPELLSSRFVAPLARSAHFACHNAMPQWAVDKVRDATDDFIEQGAAHFDSIYSAPQNDEAQKHA